MNQLHMAAAVVAAAGFLLLPPSIQAEAPGSRTRLANADLVVLDVETTGFSPRDERIVEIGAVRIRGGLVIAATNWLVNPGRPIPEVVVDIHGITDDMVADAPAFKELAPGLRDWLDDALLIAHNATFDVGFLANAFKLNGAPPPDTVYIDSLRLFRRWFPDSPSHRVSALMEHLGLEAGAYHRAEMDALYTARILLHGLEARPRIRTIGALIREAGGAQPLATR